MQAPPRVHRNKHFRLLRDIGLMLLKTLSRTQRSCKPVSKSKFLIADWLTFADAFVVRKFIEAKNMPHLLFYGPPGTGKTSCMLAVAKEIYGPKAYKHMTLELNASDDRGINVVRD